MSQPEGGAPERLLPSDPAGDAMMAELATGALANPPLFAELATRKVFTDVNEEQALAAGGSNPDRDRDDYPTPSSTTPTTVRTTTTTPSTTPLTTRTTARTPSTTTTTTSPTTTTSGSFKAPIDCGPTSPDC